MAFPPWCFFNSAARARTMHRSNGTRKLVFGSNVRISRSPCSGFGL